MHFAYPLSWWTAALIAAVTLLLAYAAYARPLIPLPRSRRVLLIALRACTLMAVIVFLCRPIRLLPPRAARDAVLPILVDASRSMRLTDAGGGARRIDRAVQLLRNELLPRLSREFQTEVLTFGEALVPVAPDRISADARRSDLTGALRALAERYRGQRMAGAIVLSDGGDTGAGDMSGSRVAEGIKVYPIGIGAPVIGRDREVLSVSAGEAALGNSLIDLSVSAVSHGFHAAPTELRLLANGRAVESRRVTPPADGSPIQEIFAVAPDPSTATVYTIEVPADGSELTTENNSRSVLVSPPGRKRHILIVEGAPGFEHSFLKRALAQDPGFEVDSVVRKGKNDQGQDTFLVQAGASRTATLTNGYPAAREALFVYDAIVFANVEGDFFGRDQLALTADFVSERGGGLLVLGARSFQQHGLVGTPLEEVLPVELTDRRGSIVRTAYEGAPDATLNKLTLTRDGDGHPVTRLAATADENRKKWAALPVLASTFALGGARPGAQVLAVAAATGGGVRPAIAIQRYGQGRAMVFAGEASWRWKMALPYQDRTHEMFWRQTLRWLSTSAPDPVSLVTAEAPVPGESRKLDVLVRDMKFVPVRDASVTLRVALPGGEVRELTPVLADPVSGRYTAPVRFDQPGVYRLTAQARRGATTLGGSDRWMLVGGADPEFSDPRLNEDLLRRLAVASGGRYVQETQIPELPSWLSSARGADGPPERRDLWHNGWTFFALIALLSTEWFLRRHWGLR